MPISIAAIFVPAPISPYSESEKYKPTVYSLFPIIFELNRISLVKDFPGKALFTSAKLIEVKSASHSLYASYLFFARI